jgi:alpha-tubulin suppressor-like RCC1 family protein
MADANFLTAGFLHACVIRSDLTAWCWGSNAAGQLGDGTTTDRPAPVTVQGL